MASEDPIDTIGTFADCTYSMLDIVVGAVLTVRDDTERWAAEAALRRSEARIRSVLEGMDEGFVKFDRNLDIVEINAEGLRIDGRPREEIVGRNLLDVWPESTGLPTLPLLLQGLRLFALGASAALVGFAAQSVVASQAELLRVILAVVGVTGAYALAAFMPVVRRDVAQLVAAVRSATGRSPQPAHES